MRRSKLLAKLREDLPVLVGLPTPYMSAKLVELMWLIGYDCAWLDHEHQDICYDQIWHMCLAARATDMDAMVRIRRERGATVFAWGAALLGCTSILGYTREVR